MPRHLVGEPRENLVGKNLYLCLRASPEMDHDQPLGDVTLCKSSEFLFFFDDDSTPRTPVTENAGSPGDDNDNLFEQTEEVLSVGVPSDLRLGTGCQEEALPVFRAVFERDDFDETTKFLDSAIDDDSDEPFLPDDLDSADKERSALPPLSPRDFLVASPSNEDAGMADCTSTSAEMSDDEIGTQAVEVQGSSVGLGGVEPVQEEQVMPCETETAAPGSSQPPRAGRAPRGGRSKRLNTERVVEALRKAFEHCARTTSSIVSPTGEERKLLRLETVSAEEMNADYNLTPTHVKPLKNERSGHKYLKKVRFEAAVRGDLQGVQRAREAGAHEGGGAHVDDQQHRRPRSQLPLRYFCWRGPQQVGRRGLELQL